MNSGRTKYTSTPTYGMQRRGFGKRQTEKPINPDVDFTQKPTPEFDAPVTGGPDSYMPQQGINGNPMPQQGNIPFQPYTVPPQGVNTAFPPQDASIQGTYPVYAPEPANPYGGTNPPFTGTPMPQMPPLANAASAPRIMNGNTRAQGFVPPTVTPAEPIASPVMQPNAAPPDMMYPPQGQPQFAAQQPRNQPMFSGQPPVNQPNGAMDGFPGYSNGNQPPAPPPEKRNKPPVNMDNWLKMLLYIVLPVIFVLCIALPTEFDILRYLFLTVCAASVGMLWFRQAFTSSLRTGITIGYGLMCVIVAVVMFSGSNSDTVSNGANITPKPTPTITDEPSGEALGYAADQPPQATEPEPVSPSDTEAGQRLSGFMDSWKLNNIEEMLEYVLPSWRSRQTDAAVALFNIIANRTPLEYDIESVSGMSGDTSVSVMMNATIDKNNGKDPVRYRFLILMDKEEEDWYIDPNTLSTNDTDPTETPYPDNLDAIFTMAPRMTVSPVPPPSTLLYYNPNGGKYYHADPACSAVNEKYLPMASFTYGEINDSPYNSLKPCLKCNAPIN